MPLTPAEKQRRYRERKKEAANQKSAKQEEFLRASEDKLQPYLSRPFSEFLREHEHNLMLYEILDWVGVEIHGDLVNEVHPINRANEWQDQGTEINTLNRVTAMVDIFIDAAKELSQLINEYKLEEIDCQMLSASSADKVRLEYMRKPLTKRTSHFFPVIEVKEI